MRVLENLLQPTGFLWLILLVSAVVLWRRRQILWGLFAFGSATLLWTVGATPLPARLLASLERPYAALARNPPSADAVVMLGGTHNYSSRTLLPMNFGESVDRVTTALELIRLGRARVLVLGGGHYLYQGQRRPESELLEVWMRGWKLPTGELISLGINLNTHEEAEHLGQLARSRGWRRILLVTTACHLRRGVAVFKKVRIDAIPIGCDFQGLDALDEPKQLWKVVPDIGNLIWFQTWFHEELGWWWYRLKGWV